MKNNTGLFGGNKNRDRANMLDIVSAEEIDFVSSNRGAVKQKINVIEKPEIVVHGTIDKPYFKIRYLEVGKDDYSIGYSSCDLKNCFQWLEECFEVIDDPVTEFKNGRITFAALAAGLRQMLEKLQAASEAGERYIDAVEDHDNKGYINFADDFVCAMENPETVDEKVVHKALHYQNGEFEVIDEMIIAFGAEAAITFCKLNSWKYRARAAYKGNAAEDMKKSDEYLKMAYEIMKRRSGPFGQPMSDNMCLIGDRE